MTNLPGVSFYRPASFTSRTAKGTLYHLGLSASGDVSAYVDQTEGRELAGAAEFVSASSDGPCVRMVDTLSGLVVRLSVAPSDIGTVRSMFDQSLPIGGALGAVFVDRHDDEDEDEDEDREDDEDPRCGMCRGDGCPSCRYTGGAYD